MTKRAAGRSGAKGRDHKGRFLAGHSGNPQGRPLKAPEIPKLLDELLAEKLWAKVPVTGADGKRRTVSAYEQIIEGLVSSLATAKPREKMQILEWMENRALFHHMKIMADDDAANPFEEQHDEWLESRLRTQMLGRLIRRIP